MTWTFSPFVTARKRFYTAVIWSRLLMVLVGGCHLLASPQKDRLDIGYMYGRSDALKLCITLLQHLPSDCSKKVSALILPTFSFLCDGRIRILHAITTHHFFAEYRRSSPPHNSHSDAHSRCSVPEPADCFLQRDAAASPKLSLPLASADSHQGNASALVGPLVHPEPSAAGETFLSMFMPWSWQAL